MLKFNKNGVKMKINELETKFKKILKGNNSFEEIRFVEICMESNITIEQGYSILKMMYACNLVFTDRGIIFLDYN
jgi:hypothetical protein